MNNKITKLEAIFELLFESNTTRISKASLKRTKTACKALELNESDTDKVLSYLEFGDFDDSGKFELYPKFK